MSRYPKEMTEHRKKHLTDTEWNAIQELTRVTKLDSVFDVTQNRKGEDCFYDFENRRYASLRAGLGWIYESLAYPLNREVSLNEAITLRDLFVEFGHVSPTESAYNWLIQ